MKHLFAVDKHDLLIALLAIFAFTLYIAVFTYVYFARDLQSKEGIMNRNYTGLVLTDRHGTPFFKFYEASIRKTVPLSEISPELKNAVIAAEDKDFYKHPGFSISAMIAAMIANIKHNDLAYGGSTITQQLVKNSLLTTQKSFLRKFQEIVLAQEIERKYTKDEILEMYLNSVYFGEGAFGAESASRVYFDKAAKDLTVAEASMLAGILTAPTELSPLNGSQNKAIERQNYVLNRMLESGYITPDQKKRAQSEKLNYATNQDVFSYKAPHFALWVRDQLIQRYGEETVIRSGFTVKTSLDLKTQEYTQKVVSDQVKNLQRNNATNGAAIIMDAKTGEILALVGNKSWADEKDGKINMATSPRQPGSSFKPIIYATALENRTITPSTVLKDEKTTFRSDPFSPPYTPNNYDGKFRGSVLPRRALANSLNVPAVEVMNKVGVENGLKTAERFGIKGLTDPSNYGLSLVLGAAEVSLVDMTGAYGVFANQGKYIEPTAILEIQDKYGKDVFAYKPSSSQVLSEESAFQISSFLSDRGARREMFGNALDIPKTAAVKTGTTENYRDALTLGYTPSVVIGVWVGNTDNSPMDQVAGSLGAAPIWKNLMIYSLQNKPDEPFVQPSGIVALNICTNNGMKAIGGGYTEYYIRGSEPTGTCNVKPVEKKDDEKKDEEKKDEAKPSEQPTPSPEQSNPPGQEKKEEKREERGGQGGGTETITIQTTETSEPPPSTPPPQNSPSPTASTQSSEDTPQPTASP